jgi:hypothetical protein
MESIYHIVTIRVNETSWAHVWRLHSLCLRTGYNTYLAWGSANLVHVSNTPHGDAHFDIWSTSHCNPLKWSNLVHMFMKSSKL